jgi:CheY-like chemotaxis protein
VRVLEEAGFEVAGVAGDAEDLVRKAGAHKPDVVVTDIQMPPDLTDDGLRAAQKIRADQPDVGVLVLSQFLEDRHALDLVGDHAKGIGYLLKDKVGDPERVHRRRPAGGARRVVAGPRRGGAHGRAAARRRQSARRAHPALAGGDGPDGRRPLQPGHRRLAQRHRRRRRASRHVDLGKLGLHQAPEDHRRVLAVLEYLKR